MRVVVIDDEPLAHVALGALLDRHPDVEVVGEALSGRDAIARIVDLVPDLVFLDVKMGETSGFDVLRALPLVPLPLIVVVTAFEQYALEAFEIAAFDYLTKPVAAERLGVTLNRVRDALQHRRALSHQTPPSAEGLPAAGATPPYASRLAVRMGARSLVLVVRDIDWIEANGYCATLHVGRRVYTVREALSTLGRRLDPSQFLRVHRTAIVNVERVVELRHGVRGTLDLVLVDGTRVTVSRRRQRFLTQLLRPS